MNWSFKLGNVSGIALKVHWTFLLLLVWVFTSELMAKNNTVMAAEGVLFIIILFGCVVLHELGHALTAKRFGVDTKDITLLPIGGVARLDRIPEDPWQELWIAIAGPAVNVIIGTVLWMFLGAFVGFQHVLSVEVLTETLLGRLLLVNVMLVVFNMLPAFPMDGGRVLRAILAMRYDYVIATERAATVGQIMAVLFGVLGLMSNGFLIFIALFVYFGAQQEAMQVRMKAMMKGVPVEAAMIRHFYTLNHDDSLGTAAGELLSGDQHDFPVIDAGRLVGVLTRNDLLQAIKMGHLNDPVSEVMHRDCPVVHDTDLLEPVFSQMQQQDCPATPVTRNGRIVGVVNLDNVGEWLAIQSALRTVTGSDLLTRPSVQSIRSVKPMTRV
jgi:Zn-dependent protease/CBS domain-containing protein